MNLSERIDPLLESLRHIDFRPMPPVKRYDPDTFFDCDATLRSFSRISTIPEHYRKQFAIGLSYFPELKNTPIRIKFRRVKTTMQARPVFSTIFTGSRVYQIVINEGGRFSGIEFQQAPFNAQVGVIAHELSHLLDFEFKGSSALLQTGFSYLFPSGKRRYERAVDLMTLLKGAGWQLHDWARYSMFDSPQATPAYKAFKRKYYLNPSEILQIMKSMETYTPTF